MNILVLAGDIPATTNMPGSPRLFNLCRGLSQRHRLTLVTQSRSHERYQCFLDDPAAEGVFKDIVILPNPPAPGWCGQQVHRLRQEAYFVTRYRSPEYYAEQCQKIRDMVVQGAIDLLYVDGSSMAQYVMNTGPTRPAIIDLHDCGTLLISRTMHVQERWLRRLALYAETRSIARVERSLSRVFRLIITNSRVDEAFFKTLDPSANTLTIGNGVDCEFFHPAHGGTDMSKLIFTGVMNYGPNEDAAIYFCDAILPLVQERHPYVQFWVVGKDPTEKVRVLAQRAGVHVAGGVPDIRPYLQTAGIFVCPIRYGAGIKNKLLAALAMQKAVVATRQSIEGLDLREDEDLLIADAPEQFAAKVMRLLEDPAYAKRLGQNGQAFVAGKYSWESSAKLLEDTLRGVVSHYQTDNGWLARDRLLGTHDSTQAQPRSRR